MKTSKCYFVSILAVSVILAGCETGKETAGSADRAAVTRNTSADAAFLEISKNRSRAQDSVSDIKKRLKENSSQYAKARKLYREARAENNSWLDLLQSKIRSGSKPEKSPDFNEQSKKAAAATEHFLEYADSLDQSAEAGQTAFAAGIGAAEVIKIFVDNGITIWKVYAEQRQADRERNAKDLDRLKWEGWEAEKKGNSEKPEDDRKPGNPKKR